MPFITYLIVLLFFVALGVIFMFGAGLAIALLLKPKPTSPSSRFFLFYFPLFGALVTAAAPLVLIFWMVAPNPARDFESYFGMRPPPTVKILKSAGSSAFVVDALEVDLLLSVPDKREWVRLATAAALDLSLNDPPARMMECEGPVEFWERAWPDPPMNWDEKWALYCPTDSRVRAYAVSID